MTNTLLEWCKLAPTRDEIRIKAEREFPSAPDSQVGRVLQELIAEGRVKRTCKVEHKKSVSRYHLVP